MTRSLAMAALASGAAAFMSPMPTPGVRLAGAMPGVTSRVGGVAPSCVSRRAPLRLAMRTERCNSQGDAPVLAKKADRSAFAKSVSKVVLMSVASALFLSTSSLAATTAVAAAAPAALGWWHDAKFWGFLGAIAGWGMSLAAIKDAATAGPEIISENMTFVMLIYSSLFAWWAWIVTPQNLLLCACHCANILAQANQARRLVSFKLSNGQGDEVAAMGTKAAAVAVGGTAAVLGGPMLQSAVVAANLGGVSTFAAAKAGPFTVHFWAPMSKWLISGASFLDLNRPTDKISIAQYTALTLTGAFFTRYALLVSPVNYVLCSVNIALFVSSAWQLGRKVKADYFSPTPAAPMSDANDASAA